METYWLQLTGTSMGTPVACVYATTSFGHHKNTEILTMFQPNLCFYRKNIDDILGVWLPLNQGKLNSWQQFKDTLNNGFIKMGH